MNTGSLCCPDQRLPVRFRKAPLQLQRNWAAAGAKCPRRRREGGTDRWDTNLDPDPNVTYSNGSHDYSVSISASESCGTASATLVIRIYQ